jgi:GT2 family glycosyltransferase/glycosyltransferase involved in cell wall biosynthesis
MIRPFPAANPRLVCVLGMHRSGTSLVTRMLNVLGVYLGPDGHLMKPQEDNPRGFWEHQLITDLNDAIFARLGGSWDEPPMFSPGWESAPGLADLRRTARAVIREDFAAAECWGWKDPRTCLTLPFWRRLLPAMRYVLCFRNPVDVAYSLHRRNGFSAEKSTRLWLTHGASALGHTAGQPRLLVFYEDVMRNWQAELRRLARFVDAPELAEQAAPQSAVQEFLEEELQHHRTSVIDAADDGTLPFSAKSLYVALRLYAELDRDGAGDQCVPDALLGDCVDRLGLYAVTAQTDLARLEGALTSASAGLEQARSEIVARDTQLNCVQAELARLGDQVQVQESELVHLRVTTAERDSLRDVLTIREAELARAQMEVHARDGDLGRLTLEVARRSQEVDRLSTEVERLQLTLGALQRSASWKIPRPLRAMKGGARLLRRAPRRFARAISREAEPLLADRPRILRIVRATRAVVSRLSPRTLRSLYLIAGSGLFDRAFYLAQNPDVRDSGMAPVMHYLLYGAREGRDPHPGFDTSFYCEANPDVVQAGVNPLVHYLRYGAREGRDPHPLFETSFCREQSPHVRDPGVNPLVHPLAEGPTADFDPLSSAPPLPETGVCIVTPDIVGPVKNGGIGTACYHFARVLAEAGHPVSVFFTGDVTDSEKAHWRNAFAKMGIKFIAISDAPPVTRLVYGSTWFFERSWRVFQYLRKAQFSVVHFQDWQANGFWSIKAKQVGLAFEQTALTVMTHSCTKWINEGMQQFSAAPFETAKLVWAETYCVEHCDVLLSPSRYMLQWVGENQIHTPPRTLLTPYAWADAAPAAPRMGGPADSDHLIFFGRLETRKGLHIFGEALRQLQRESVALPREVSLLGKHASVLGQSSTEYLEDLRRDLPTVEMHIINDFDYAHALDYIQQTRGLVVIPSILDNYPLTVIECIQTGIPFIAANTGGIPEMVDASVSFEPNPASLAARLKTRHTIDHRGIEHKYSPSLAAGIWRDLHAELRAAQASNGDGSPEQGTARVRSVSVCIPFFNHQQYLETLVTAFERQSYPAFEVILVNDGSSSEASQEFERVAARNRDGRFRFRTTENRGPGAARNFAVEQATGDLLLFFDADNVPKGPDFITTLVHALERSNADCVTCPYDIVSADRILVTKQDVVAAYRPIGACIEAGFFENIFGDATMIITHSAFKQLGGFPTQRASWEDHEFLLKLCFEGFKLETLPEEIFYYRQSPNGRNQQANVFRNYQSLFNHLQAAPSGDLARIIAAVSGPMLVGRRGSPTAGLVAR